MGKENTLDFNPLKYQIWKIWKTWVIDLLPQPGTVANETL